MCIATDMPMNVRKLQGPPLNKQHGHDPHTRFWVQPMVDGLTKVQYNAIQVSPLHGQCGVLSQG